MSILAMPNEWPKAGKSKQDKLSEGRANCHMTYAPYKLVMGREVPPKQVAKQYWLVNRTSESGQKISMN